MPTQESRLEATYLGEPSPRSPGVAFGAALLCPGLGWAYLGNLRAAFATNALLLGLALTFLVVWSTAGFYPVVPFRAFVGGWLLLTLMMALDVRRHARHAGPDYVLRDANHPLIYGAVALLGFAAPLAGLRALAAERVWPVATVSSDAMYPTLLRGEDVLVDGMAYRASSPRQGDVILYAVDGGPPRFARVVAGPGSDVVVSWNAVFVDDAPSPRAAVGASAAANVERFSGELDDAVRHFVETRDGATYPIVGPAHAVEFAPLTWSLGADQFIVLNDNRADSGDSRQLGAVRRDDILGRAAYIAPTGGLLLRAFGLSGPGDAREALREGRRVQPIRRRRNRG